MRDEEGKGRWKKHLPYVLVILLAASLVHHQILLHPKELFVKHDISGYEYINMNELAEQIMGEGEFPLWTNHIFGGTPFFAQPQVPVTPHLLMMVLLFHWNISVLINLSILFNVMLGGVLMYYLMVRLRLEERYALISAMVFMFSGAIHILTFSWFGRQTTVQFVPLVFLFYYLALNDDRGMRQAIVDAIIGGLVLSLQFLSGGLNYALFMVILFMALALGSLLGKGLKERVKRIVVVSLVFALVFAGAFAVKLLPLLEFGTVSSKAGGYDFETWRGGYIHINGLKDVVSLFVGTHLIRLYGGTNVGIIPTILFFMSIPLIRKRKVMSFWILFLLALLVSVGFTPLLSLFYNFVPGMDRLHHVGRSSYLWHFAAAALAGFGMMTLGKLLERKGVGKKAQAAITWILLVLIVLEMGFIENTVGPRENADKDGWGKYEFEKEFERNEMMGWLSEQEGIYRVNHFSHNMICGTALNHIAHYRQEPLYGCYSVWIPEYFNVYLSVAYQNPARLKGMLNTKYFYDREPLEAPGLKLVREFPACEGCWQNEMDRGVLDGPYLYENEQVLPRAYLAERGILVAGGADAVRQATYTLLLHPSFNPVDTVVVMENSLEDIPGEELGRYEAILLLDGQVSEGVVGKLRAYVQGGGMLLPSLFEGKTGITEEEVEALLNQSTRPYAEVRELRITEYTNNRRTIELPGGEGSEGFVVLAEKFALFEGWEPKLGKRELPLLQANGINSAVYVSGEKGELRFRYLPSSFVKGAVISALTLLAAVGFILYLRSRERKRSVAEVPPSTDVQTLGKP